MLLKHLKKALLLRAQFLSYRLSGGVLAVNVLNGAELNCIYLGVKVTALNARSGAFA